MTKPDQLRSDQSQRFVETARELDFDESAKPVGKTRRARVGKPLTDAEPELSQREKFIQTARELECDETGDALDEALRTIGKARRR